jgi:hypothetical protein
MKLFGRCHAVKRELFVISRMTSSPDDAPLGDPGSVDSPTYLLSDDDAEAGDPSFPGLLDGDSDAFNSSEVERQMGDDLSAIIQNSPGESPGAPQDRLLSRIVDLVASHQRQPRRQHHHESPPADPDPIETREVELHEEVRDRIKVTVYSNGRRRTSGTPDWKIEEDTHFFESITAPPSPPKIHKPKISLDSIIERRLRELNEFRESIAAALRQQEEDIQIQREALKAEMEAHRRAIAASQRWQQLDQTRIASRTTEIAIEVEAITKMKNEYEQMVRETVAIERRNEPPADFVEAAAQVAAQVSGMRQRLDEANAIMEALPESLPREVNERIAQGRSNGLGAIKGFRKWVKGQKARVVVRPIEFSDLELADLDRKMGTAKESCAALRNSIDRAIAVDLDQSGASDQPLVAELREQLRATAAVLQTLVMAVQDDE